ncbi:sensor domain-containing diguanylate cyclase [Alkalibacter saccharofermentans]|uniref:PAS domain S-box-containing protein/diguanylate cyclase (GGDEF) domain-containing protein n=1 Tax=Alkalibacter saccharofermentans DSM 14828 TaxID=1120975 RepID=A0A1M4WDM6_9FIRM|nr:sensor domain-containing diguanylate cyclase [Alkalibacter saccharofermentans]SHE79082.1 PAS domain S-box-containing protein/diguanylate cyclase (GGDEF) domain-containing protein [Alkalibacter saccharofermentans DSM 14828]
MSLSLNEYKVIVESAPNLIWRSGLDAKCYYFNKTWLDFTGRTLEQEYGDGWSEGVHPDDFERCVKIYLGNFSKRTRFEMEYRLLRHDGEWRWINDIGVPTIDENGEFTGFIGSCLDVTERVEGLMLKEMAQKDGLTEIFSRQYLMSLFDYEFESAKRTGSKLSVAMMDIDKFKSINDMYGHLGGDSALKMFASVVKDTVRQNDLFGRYGGDEFVIIFPNTTVEEAKKIVDRIANSLKKMVFKIDHNEIEISISVGLCELTDENSPDEMINVADKMMYENKKNK